MQIRQNIVKAWITSIMGTLLMATSLFLWFFGFINLIWEGAAGLIIGCILLLAPKTIEKKVSEAIKSWGGRNDIGGFPESPNPNHTPPMPPAPPREDEMTGG